MIQIFYSVLTINCKISKSKNAVILLEIILSLQKGRYTFSICLNHLCEVSD